MIPPEEERQLSDDEVAPGTELEIAAPEESTAAAKIMQALRDISSPKDDAGELELMLATVAMGLERTLGQELARTQATGELDEFLAGLTRWFATLRSDSAWRLVVIEMPRKDLPNGKRLHLLDEAEELAEVASLPL